MNFTAKLKQAVTGVITDSEFQVSSQFAHFFTAAYLASQAGRWHTKGLIIAGVGLFIWASFKEGIWDHYKESVEVRGSSWLDWSMYMAGTVVGLLTRFR
jgi:hypothetical protein